MNTTETEGKFWTTFQVKSYHSGASLSQGLQGKTQNKKLSTLPKSIFDFPFYPKITLLDLLRF